MNRLSFLILLSFIFVYGKSQNAPASLTKAQLYEDYDQFISIVENFNPQLEIRKIVTGEDNLKVIKQMRKNIENLQSPEKFVNVMSWALNALNDQHASLFTNKNNFAFTGFDSLAIEEALQLVNSCYNEQERFDIADYFPIHLDYFNGDYLSVYYLQIRKLLNPADTTNLPIGSVIKKINGKEVTDYFQGNQLYYNWDNSLKRKYTRIRGVSKSLKIGEVKYFDEGNILYIRMPQMANGDFYVNQILEKAKGKDIEKVIWDIRRNSGGNDRVWHRTLEVLLDDTLKYKVEFAFLNTKLAKKAIEGSQYAESTKLPFLKGKYKILHTKNEIVPADSSIRYKGNIYILQDRYIYSSAGSLSTLARQSDRLTTVGMTTGNMLGAGLLPQHFQLKNTKLVFQIEPVLDVTHIKEPYDYYQDKVEIPVDLTKEEWIRYFKERNETLYSKEFLFNYDAIFRKALEQ